MLEGSIRHGVDLEQLDINNNELLFVLPHPVHRLPATHHDTDYFKIGSKSIKHLEENLSSENVRLTAVDLKEIETIMPSGIASGTRYPEKFMSHLNR